MENLGKDGFSGLDNVLLYIEKLVLFLSVLETVKPKSIFTDHVRNICYSLEHR